MKRIMSVLLILALCMGMLTGLSFATDTVASGNCGENLSWVLDTEGTLVISGSGEMSEDAPWREYCPEIRSVIIGDSVTSICRFAFEACENLSNVVIGNAVKSIGRSAFIDCYSLTEIVIPASVESIGNYAFSSTGLVEVYIPASVTSIGVISTFGCQTIEKFVVAENNPAYASPDGNLYNKEQTLLLQYAVAKKDLSFTIPNTVETIAEQAFWGCEYLVEVTIPDSVVSIGESAFGSCCSLENVHMGESVTAIGPFAFSGCSSLKEIHLPASVVELGESVFDFSENLTSITVDGDNPVFSALDGNLYNKDQTTLIQYATGKPDTTFTIPNTVTTIGYGSCANSLNLVSVVIESPVETIEGWAFYCCPNLETVTIGNSVKEIGEYAFYLCGKLSTLNMGKSVANIGEAAFEECPLEKINYQGNESQKDQIIIGDANSAFSDAIWDCLGSAAPAEVSVATVNGAQIRTKGKQGLRFISTIDKASAKSERVVEYGTILIPSDDIDDISELVIGATLNGHKVAKVPAQYLYAEDDETVTFTAVITDIKEKNYNRAYTARAYAILEDDTVIYSDVAPSRDVYTIAGKVLENETLSEEETAFLIRVIRYVEGVDIGINFAKPVEDAQVPLSIEVDGYNASITWTRIGGAVHTGKFESGTDYTATIVLTGEETFSPNDRVTINGENVSYTLSSDGSTITVKKTYEFKDSGYSGIY